MDFYPRRDQDSQAGVAWRLGSMSEPRDVTPPEAPSEREDELDWQEIDDELDEGIAGSFPASDPPSIVSPKRSPQRAPEQQTPGGEVGQ